MEHKPVAMKSHVGRNSLSADMTDIIALAFMMRSRHAFCSLCVDSCGHEQEASAVSPNIPSSVSVKLLAQIDFLAGFHSAKLMPIYKPHRLHICISTRQGPGEKDTVLIELCLFFSQIGIPN